MSKSAPIYEFAGRVESVRGHLCDLVMQDRTDVSRPDEIWTIATAQIAPVVVGQGVKFTITSRRGFFTVDRRVWTEKEIQDMKKRAAEYTARFRKIFDEAESAAAVARAES